MEPRETPKDEFDNIGHLGPVQRLNYTRTSEQMKRREESNE
jgi:hypothetical protein